MNLNFLFPQFLWLLLGIPLVILLHFVRARKKRWDVSALFLWKQAKEQAETRKRFSPSWLLFLQILSVALAALALAQPSLALRSRPDRVLIIDATASMAARDSDGSRLEKALQKAQKVLQESGRIAILRSGLETTVVQALTDNHSEATRALQSVQATDEQTDLTRAIDVAKSLAPQAEIHVFTDSAFDYPLVTIHGVGGDGLNVGISGFEVGVQQIFVAVASNYPRPQEINISIFQGDTAVAQSTMLVPSNAQGYTTFPLDNTSGFFRAEIQVPADDALAIDNLAFTGQRELRIASRSDNEILQRVFEALPNVRYRVLPNAVGPDVDIKVIEGPLPPDATGNYIAFSPAVTEPTYKTIQTWDRASPLLRFVDLSKASVGLAEPLVFTEGTVLAETLDAMPVLLEHKTPSLHAIAMNVHPTQTDLIRRTAFPLLMANIIDSFRAGETLPLGSPLPEGASLENKAKTFTDEPGIYQINNHMLSSSLLNAEETRLPHFSEVITPEIPTSSDSVARVRNVALALLSLALIVLLFEWILWSHRRDGWQFGFGNLGFSLKSRR
jgi:uncharacterized protein (DUF1778 family)